jgi:hypothetical protein
MKVPGGLAAPIPDAYITLALLAALALYAHERLHGHMSVHFTSNNLSLFMHKNGML